jgi:tRNA(fMet)-specific endonuclease VapC
LTLLDTNVLIHYLRGLEPVTSRIKMSSPAELAVPAVVSYELEYGTLKGGSPRRSTMLAHVLAELEEISFDGAAARAAAEIRVALESRGLTIGPLDLLIAGTAVSRGAVLATNNTQEFHRIEGLRLQDWSATERTP